MYKIVYVLVDDGSLYYYNELMKSITSLKMHMDTIAIEVVVDTKTESVLRQNKTEIIDMGILHTVAVPDEYNVLEKSRYLKVTLREHIKGDYLFIDTDTVICEAFPDVISRASIGMVLELHDLRSVVNDKQTDERDSRCGLDLHGYDYYFNSGVIWSRDDEDAHKFYQEWHDMWEQTRKTGYHIDQPSLNYIVPKWIDKIDILDGRWNVQIARMLYAPINYFANAYILHYMNFTWSPYIFCRPEIRKLDYKDPVILNLLKNPKVFARCRIIALDNENNYLPNDLAEYERFNKTRLYKLYRRIYHNKIAFPILETSLRCISGVVRRVRGLVKKYVRQE